MKYIDSEIRHQFLAQARHSLDKQHLPRITRCLKLLDSKQIWWRPHPTSNSVGNLVLHLAGNVRQWIISGPGGQRDCRKRDLEFSEQGPLPRQTLIRLLQRTVSEANHVLANISAAGLMQKHKIQGYKVTGWEAIAHVTEHFAYHTGQIIYATKLLRGVDLGFTHLPGDKPRKRPSRPLSQH